MNGKMIKGILSMIGGAGMIENAVKSNADSFISFLKDLSEKKVELLPGEVSSALLLFPSMPNPDDNVLAPDKETILAFVCTLDENYAIARKITYYDLRNELMTADIKQLINTHLK